MFCLPTNRKMHFNLFLLFFFFFFLWLNVVNNSVIRGQLRSVLQADWKCLLSHASLVGLTSHLDINNITADYSCSMTYLLTFP